MSTRYEVIAANELDASLVSIWRSIQARNPSFASPYFCPEFTQAVARVQRNVRIAVVVNGARPVGFLPYERSFLGCGKPVGGPLSDFHGIIADPESDWDLLALMRAARL